MDDNLNSILLPFLDSETKLLYLTYYLCKVLDETDDEEYVYKLECLYEWWEFEQREMFNTNDSTGSSNGLSARQTI